MEARTGVRAKGCYMLLVRKNFMVWRRLLRTLAAFLRLRTMLGFSKKRRRRTSLRMRSPCTTLLNRFSADSNDSLSSTITRVKNTHPSLRYKFRRATL